MFGKFSLDTFSVKTDRCDDLSAKQMELCLFASFSILTKGSGEDYAKEKWKRPPSSYGSMRSESEEMEEEEEEGGAGVGVGVGTVAEDRADEVVAVLPEPPPQVDTRYSIF